MRSLGHLWSVLEEGKKDNLAKEDSIGDILQLAENTVVLLGLAN